MVRLTSSRKRYLEQLFNGSIFLKLIHGIFEIIFGFILFFISTSSIVKITEFIFSKELIEDRHDFFVNLALNFSHNLSVNVKEFIGIYFIVFGIINFWLAFILLTKRVKHYTYVEAVIAILIVYQIYKFVRLNSFIILFFAIIDILILALIFKYHKSLLNQ